MDARAQGYIDQSAADLRVSVVRGAVDATQFTILSRGALQGERLEVRAGIIGASHLLEVREAGETRLCEVLACVDPGSPEAPARQLHSACVGERAENFTCSAGAGLVYCFQSQVAHAGAGQERLERLEARVSNARGQREIGLTWTFMRPDDASAPRFLPRTLVWARVDSVEGSESRAGLDRVQVETAHCYPNDHVIVFSESRIERQPEGAGK